MLYIYFSASVPLEINKQFGNQNVLVLFVLVFIPLAIIALLLNAA